MTTQANIIVETTGGHKVEILPYITGGQALSLNDVPGETVGARAVAGVKKTIEMLCVSFDGSTENVLQKILDLPMEEYMVIKDKVNEVADYKKKATSTTSDNSSTGEPLA